MTVCTNDLALRNLVSEGLPAPVAHPLGDVEFLVSEVVEFKDHGIGLTAVAAWVGLEVVDEELEAALGQKRAPPAGRIDVPLAITGVVLLLVCRSAGPAVVVTLTLVFTTPVEVTEWEELITTSAPS
jgi:hypothetical protein